MGTVGFDPEESGRFAAVKSKERIELEVAGVVALAILFVLILIMVAERV